MKFVLFIILFGLNAVLFGQEIIYKTQDSFTIQGKISENGPRFSRIDPLKYSNLPQAVKKRLAYPAGLFVHFLSNTTQVNLQWSTKEISHGVNMNGIMARGMDLYIKEGNQWIFAGVARPTDQKQVSNFTMVKNRDNSLREFLIYLPLWAEVTDMKIGIDANASFQDQKRLFKKKVVVYGSSIVHGASASRSGMTYPAIIERNTNYQLINLGVSGSAKMETEVADMLKDAQDVDLFILDCVPNASPEEITERTQHFVKHIRRFHPKTPILMIESTIRPMSMFDHEWNARVRQQNERFYNEYQQLKAQGDLNLHLLRGDNLLGSDNEGTTDGSHPNDLGFSRMVNIIQPAIEAIFNDE